MSCYPATLLSEVSDRNVRYILLDWIYNESSEIPPWKKLDLFSLTTDTFQDFSRKKRTKKKTIYKSEERANHICD